MLKSYTLRYRLPRKDKKAAPRFRNAACNLTDDFIFIDRRYLFSTIKVVVKQVDLMYEPRLFTVFRYGCFLFPLSVLNLSLLSRHRITGIACSLAALFLFQAAGWFLAWGILQYQAKTAAFVALSRKETTFQIFTFSTQRLHAIRVGKKEIRHEGRLYDIKNQIARGDSVQLVVYHDECEEDLFKALGSLFLTDKDTTPAQSSALFVWLAKCLGTVFLPPSVPGMAIPDYAFRRPCFDFLLYTGQCRPDCALPPPRG